MYENITKALRKGRKTWSVEAAELQLLHKNQENRTKEGQGFCKLDETSMKVVRDELSNDFYTLTTQHISEMIVREHH